MRKNGNPKRQSVSEEPSYLASRTRGVTNARARIGLPMLAYAWGYLASLRRGVTSSLLEFT
jgi:hypothetical protein